MARPKKRTHARAPAKSGSHGPQASEQRFHGLLRIAGLARKVFDERLLAGAGARNLGRDDLPEHLLMAMSYWASVQHRTMLASLATAENSYGAEILARGLLEFLANVAFVLGKETDTPIGSSRQRSICLGVARTAEEYQAYLEAEEAGDIPHHRSSGARVRLERLLELHTDYGCPVVAPDQWPCRAMNGSLCLHYEQWPCKGVVGKSGKSLNPQARRIVKSTLRRLAKREPNMSWLVNLYVTGSLLAHQQLIDRIMRDDGAGLDLPSSPDYRYRASILWAGFSAYGKALEWILEQHSPISAQGFGAAVDSLYSSPAYQEAASGRWDR
jgi:hypothetical protein